MYKLVCKDLNVKDIYVGSTTNFIERKARHRNNCKNPSNQTYNIKVYQMIRNNGGWDNWDMIQIEAFPCENGNEARARERYWYETLQASMNSRIPFRSHEELIEIQRERDKERYYSNKDKAVLKRKTRTQLKNTLQRMPTKKRTTKRISTAKYR